MTASRLDRLAPGLFVLLWSTGFIGARLGLPYIEPLQFLSLRYACVIMLLALLAAIARAPMPRAAEIPHIAIAGLFLQAGCLGGVFIAIKQGLGTAAAALIVGLQPILTALAARPLLGERTSWKQWVGLILGLAGVALVVLHQAGKGKALWSTLVPIIIALLSITAGALYQKRYCPRFDLRTGSAIQFAASLAVTAPLSLAFENGTPQWTWQLAFALIWLVLVLSLGAISLLHSLIRSGSAVGVASLFYLTAPTAGIMAWALFGETMPVLALVGFAVAVGGVALARKN